MNQIVLHVHTKLMSETVRGTYLHYHVQGDHVEWLGCALYVAGQSSSLETVEGQAMSGNNISLTQILRETGLK